jgi:hypothetical protein
MVSLRARSALGAINRFPVLRRALLSILVACSCVALALGGLWLGLRLSSAGTYPSALGTVSFQLEASSRGEVEVFIPLADWGLRAHAFSAPLTLHVEPRALNRPALLAAASGNRQVLKRTATDLTHDARLAIERAVRYLLLGVLIAALLGWAMLRIYRCENRRLLIALPAGTVLAALAMGGGALLRLQSTWRPAALNHPTYYARGAELIQLLNAAQHASSVKDSYASKIEGALSGFASLLADPGAGALDGGRRSLLVSDLHNNTLVLGPLSFYAQGQPVFFPGDFGNTGDAGEIRALVPAVSHLGSEVIAVSGDHDSHAMMLALARRGVIVLSSHGQLLPDGRYGAQSILVQGLRVAGFDDPMEYHGSKPDDPGRIFSLAQLPDYERASADAQQHLLDWFESLSPRPDVLLVHENGLAQYLARTLYNDGYSRPLSILSGHDHIQHVNHDGPIDIIDAGTVGAAGVYGIGEDYVGLGELHFDAKDPALQAADLIQVEPVSGVAQAQRVVLGTGCGLSHTNCTDAVDFLDPREGPNTAALGGASAISPLDPAAGAKVP